MIGGRLEMREMCGEDMFDEGYDDGLVHDGIGRETDLNSLRPEGEIDLMGNTFGDRVAPIEARNDTDRAI